LTQKIVELLRKLYVRIHEEKGNNARVRETKASFPNISRKQRLLRL